ncbi:MAG: LytTR family DNA-binding domain-containing protein [Candidatus Solibacter sp.]
MRSLIIDDEEPARARLGRMLAAHPDIAVVGEARDGLEALSQIEALRPELLFLDIQMPGLSGFEVLEALLPEAPAPLVIFVTGYDQYALAAFEANALSYLLKPVEAERLAQALDRARKLSGVQEAAERAQVLRVAREAPKSLQQIVCRRRDRVLLVPPEQVCWFQVEDGVVKAHTVNETFTVNYQLGELEAGLPPDVFFRARREVLVNLTRMREIRPYFKSGFLLVMADGGSTEIVVSERQARSLRQRIPGL